MKDVIIIGAGPAGVSLALYLKRYKHNITVLTNNNSILKKAQTIENYYGFKKINGEALYNKGIKQLKATKVELLNEEVVKIEKLDNFKVYTDKNQYDAKIVVLATGISREEIKIDNISIYEGKGISYCATCDGFFFRNKKIGIIGSGNLAYEEATYLTQISDDVTLFTNGEALKRDFSELKIKIINQKIKSVIGDEKLEGLILEDNELIQLDGVFIALGYASALTFSKTLGIEMNNNFIKVDENFMTNIEGLYAIGDVIGGILQIGKASSDGILASKKINSALK